MLLATSRKTDQRILMKFSGYVGNDPGFFAVAVVVLAALARLFHVKPDCFTLHKLDVAEVCVIQVILLLTNAFFVDYTISYTSGNTYSIVIYSPNSNCFYPLIDAISQMCFHKHLGSGSDLYDMLL